MIKSCNKSSVWQREDVLAATLLLLAVLLPLRGIHAQPSSDYPAVPILHNHVLDETNSLTPDQAASLDQKLKHYEDSTSTQICIVLIPSLNGYPVEDYAVNVYDSNHIGQKNKNNGALILLAMQDHKGWITTGYGLEPTLTDAATSIVYQQILVPSLRSGDVYGGLDSATTAMFQIIGGEFKNLHPNNSRYGTRGAPSPGGVFFIVIAFFAILFLFVPWPEAERNARSLVLAGQVPAAWAGFCRDCSGLRSSILAAAAGVEVASADLAAAVDLAEVASLAAAE